MNNKATVSKGWWVHLKNFIRTNTSLAVIILAALLLEMTTGVMYYAGQNYIQQTMERLVRVEMDAIYLCIRNKLANVEVTVDNMAWVAVRRGQDCIVSMQLGNNEVDHILKEYFRIPVTEGKAHWRERYVDIVGAKAVITTYSVPFLVTGSKNGLAGKDTPVMSQVLQLLKADDDNNAYFTMKDEDGENKKR